VTRDRAQSSPDQLIESVPAGEPLFRVVGVEPHGWSTVLIEDQLGRCFIAATASGRLSEIEAAEARRLIQGRTYRRWHGDRSWTTLERMPLLSSAFTREVPPPEPTGDSPI
jgi:hypothetical protein